MPHRVRNCRYVATNEVLASAGYAEISVADYEYGCRFVTPVRFNVHVGKPEDDDTGARLSATFDDTYVGATPRRSLSRRHTHASTHGHLPDTRR